MLAVPHPRRSAGSRNDRRDARNNHPRCDADRNGQHGSPSPGLICETLSLRNKIIKTFCEMRSASTAPSRQRRAAAALMLALTLRRGGQRRTVSALASDGGLK